MIILQLKGFGSDYIEYISGGNDSVGLSVLSFDTKKSEGFLA